MGSCAGEVAALLAQDLYRPWGWPSAYFRQVTSGVHQKEGGDPEKGWVVKVTRDRHGGGVMVI